LQKLGLYFIIFNVNATSTRCISILQHSQFILLCAF